MKPNEIVLTIIQLAAPIYCFAVGLPTQGWFLTAWLVFFGICEFLAKTFTGKTLSQHVWSKPKIVRIILSVIMVAGMCALAYHFIWGG